jgi:DNA primase catalytic core
MDIHTLKSRLNILDIAHTLGIKTDKNNKAICPFHGEKTPSLQFSIEKQICTCFSSKCTAGTMDVVELVKKYKKWELPETLNWLAEQAGLSVSKSTKTEKSVESQEESTRERTKALTTLFEVFTRSFAASNKPQDYLKSRNLDPRKVKAGYNIGAFHLTANLPEGNADQYRQYYEELGLIKHHANSHGYNVFGKGCVVFPLRNKQNQIVSFYFRETDTSKPNQHYYLKNRQGLYPNYPKRETRHLILTESIIDAETLLQIPEIAQYYELLACYGTEGTKEQTEAISQLNELQEVIIFFDGDEPGKEGAEKLAKMLLELKPGVQLKIVQTPDGEDINSLVKGHQPQILTHLIKESQPFFFSKETPQEEVSEATKRLVKESSAPSNETKNEPMHYDYKLDASHPHNLKYRTETADYEIKGGIGKNGLDRLIISLHIIHPETRVKSRVRLDLYEDKQVEKTAREAGEKLGLRSDLIELDLNHLADLLDQQREQEQEAKESTTQKPYHISEEEKKAAFELLYSKGKYTGNLIQNINELIGKSGVIGEENNRAFLFCIAASHKFGSTLHALVQGSSGSGKTHLVRQITDFMPLENVIRLTRVTESSFYNYGEFDLQNKLVVIEDYDGLKEEAELAFRELQSNDELRSSVSAKDTEYGSYRTQIRVVKGPISSMAATTKGTIYEDNLSRCFVIAVDESKEQTLRIIHYQNSKAAGEIDTTHQHEIQTLLQNSIRLLQPQKVINPFANKIQLPEEAFKIRRLNSNFQSFVKQITLLNQYQRTKAVTGELLTQKEDLQTAIEIMFDSIILKVDELDGSLRDFYEKLKTYINQKGKEYEFTGREIRQDLRISKTQMQRFMNDLLELEYIERKGTGIHGATKYKISYWDDNTALKKRIKESLMNQLKDL